VGVRSTGHGGSVDSPKGWTNQDNRLWRSHKCLDRDTRLYLIRPPRRAKAKRGVAERSEVGVNFCRSESLILRAGG